MWPARCTSAVSNRMRFLPLPSSVFPAITAVTILLVAWLGWGSLRDPETLWAPEDLSRYHAGLGNCTACHEPFRGVRAEKCAGCHTEQRFASVSGIGPFHLSLMRQRRSCLDCHTEHRGRQAMITVGKQGNPHGEFIFPATTTTSCVDCHAFPIDGGSKPLLLDTGDVRRLEAKGKGAHKPGRFANCLGCHVETGPAEMPATKGTGGR
jgi:hypothetical protein